MPNDGKRYRWRDELMHGAGTQRSLTAHEAASPVACRLVRLLHAVLGPDACCECEIGSPEPSAPVALAQPLHDAGLVKGMLAGQRHARPAGAAAPGARRRPRGRRAVDAGPVRQARRRPVWERGANRHAAPADGAVAVHPLHIRLQSRGFPQARELQSSAAEVSSSAIGQSAHVHTCHQLRTADQIALRVGAACWKHAQTR